MIIKDSFLPFGHRVRGWAVTAEADHPAAAEVIRCVRWARDLVVTSRARVRCQQGELVWVSRPSRQGRRL
ncbi:hypothetical protein GCM10027184_06400 [Saccharothrix stipae]